MPGLIAVSFNPFSDYVNAAIEIETLCHALSAHDLESTPLWILTEDCEWLSASLNNFLWATFTRSNPAKDIYGVDSNVLDKHWCCRPPLIIDARIKPHHAPVLESDPAVSRKVDQMFAKGGILYGMKVKSES